MSNKEFALTFAIWLFLFSFMATSAWTMHENDNAFFFDRSNLDFWVAGGFASEITVRLIYVMAWVFVIGLAVHYIYKKANK